MLEPRRVPRSELPAHTKARLAASAAQTLHPRSRVRERINAIGRHYGYASQDDVEHHRDALRSAGCTSIGDDLGAIISELRSGDVLVVTRMRCVAGSLGELRYVVRSLMDKGATLKALTQPLDVGVGFLALLDILADFDGRTDDRTSAVKPSKGRDTGGRPALIDASKIQKLRDEGLGPSAIAAALKVSRTSVYRLMAEAK